MVLLLDVVLEVRGVEVHVAEIAGAVPFGLIVEVRRRRVAALATGGDGLCAHFFSELDYGDEAVATGAVPLLCAWIRAYSEGGKRTPQGRGEADGNTRSGAVDWRDS